MRMPDNIRYYREQAGMYQSDLGKMLGVSAQAVSKWELGKAEPDRDCIAKMCGLFKVSADTLMDIHVITNEKKEEAISLSDAERALLEDYRQLSAQGKAYIRTTITIATNSMRENDTVSVLGAG